MRRDGGRERGRLLGRLQTHTRRLWVRRVPRLLQAHALRRHALLRRLLPSSRALLHSGLLPLLHTRPRRALLLVVRELVRLLRKHRARARARRLALVRLDLCGWLHRARLRRGRRRVRGRRNGRRLALLREQRLRHVRVLRVLWLRHVGMLS